VPKYDGGSLGGHRAIVVVLGLSLTLVPANAEGVTQQSPGQAHVSATNVSAALGTRSAQRLGRADGSQLGGRFAEAEMRPTLHRVSTVDGRPGRATVALIPRRSAVGHSADTVMRPLTIASTRGYDFGVQACLGQGWCYGPKQAQRWLARPGPEQVAQPEPVLAGSSLRSATPSPDPVSSFLSEVRLIP